MEVYNQVSELDIFKRSFTVVGSSDRTIKMLLLLLKMAHMKAILALWRVEKLTLGFKIGHMWTFPMFIIFLSNAFYDFQNHTFALPKEKVNMSGFCFKLLSHQWNSIFLPQIIVFTFCFLWKNGNIKYLKNNNHLLLHICINFHLISF